MTSLEVLNAMAGVAVTLIGFSGIVVVAERRPGIGWTGLDRIVFYSMLAPSLTALFCAFVPAVLSTVIEQPDTTWRAANGVLGTAHFANLVPVLLKFRTVRFTWLQRLFMTSGVVAILAHGAAVGGFVPWAELVFLAGLMQQLMVGMFNFLQLVQADSPASAGQAAKEQASPAHAGIERGSTHPSTGPAAAIEPSAV